MPFVFQILSQMLELHQGESIPASYTALLPSLLTPTLWQTRSNVPALVRLLQAFLSKGATEVVTPSTLQSLLGIYQQLIASRVNDEHGFELLLGVFHFVNRCLIMEEAATRALTDAPALLHSANLDPYKAPALTLMLTRLQNSRTEKFSRGFVHFVASACCIDRPGFPDYVVGAFDAVQPG